jgi:hypothetical protein
MEMSLVQKYEYDLATNYGAVMHEDTYRGKNWFQFDLNGWCVWYCSRGWACARLKNDYYVDHEYFGSLGQAFEFVKNNNQV